MSKKSLVYTLVLVWCAVLLQLVVVVSMQNDKAIVEAFRAGGSVPAQSEVTVIGQYPSYLIDESAQRELLTCVAEGLGISEYTVDTDDAKLQNEETADDFVQTLTVQLLRNEAQQTMTVKTVFAMADASELISKKEQIEQIYDNLSMDAQTVIRIAGDYEGRLNESVCEQIKDSVFRVLQSRQVQSQTVSGERIYYGYTQRLAQSRSVDGERINVQLTFAYDETEDVTKFYLYSPFDEGR
jgi:hypothetical protein